MTILTVLTGSRKNRLWKGFFFFLTFIISGFILLSLSPPHLIAQPGSTFNISDAEKLNTIRYWLNQQVADLFPLKGRFLRSYNPQFSWRCATPLIHMIRQYPELLEERNRFIRYRPTDPYDVGGSYGSVNVWTYDTADGHSRIHYTEDNRFGDAVPGSDGIKDTIPPYVLKVAEALEITWSIEVDALGYLPPPPDGTYGGNSRVDCYILSISSYGYTNIDNDDYPYIVIDNNYSSVTPNHDPEGTAIGAMRSTVAHEFFHVIQYYYTDWNDLWWEENTAVWIEDEVFDFINDYLHYLGAPYEDLNGSGQWNTGEPYYDPLGNLAGYYDRKWSGWFDWPFLPLDYVSLSYDTAKYQEYGGVIWVKHLTGKYGKKIVLDIFEQINTTQQEALAALDTIILAQGSKFKLEFEEYKEKVLTGDFEEAQWYPLVWHTKIFSQYPAHFASASFYDSTHGGYIGNLDHLSSHYLGFMAPDGRGRLHFYFNKIGGSGDLSCLLMLMTQDGLWERIDLPLNPDNNYGELTVSSFGSQGEYRKIVAIIMNSSVNAQQDNTQFTLEVDFEPIPYYEISFPSGMGLFSPAIPKDQIINSPQFLLDYFIPDSLYSLSTFDRQTGQWTKNTWLEDSNSRSVFGDPFQVKQDGIYVIYLKTPWTIVLDSATNPEQKLMNQGMNFLSYSPQVLDQKPTYAFDILKDLGSNISVVRKHDDKTGNCNSAYYLFQELAGEDFLVLPGETYILEMIQETLWLLN